MKPMDIKLNIERLLLDGFAHGDRLRIGAALETELRRLIAVGALGDACRPATFGHLNAGGIAASPASRPETIGIQVAQQVVRQLGVGTTGAAPAPAPKGSERSGGGR